MRKYKVLWIDDQWDEMSSFKDLCEMVHDIEVVPCKFAVEGMKIFEQELYSWSAVILDAKVLKESENETARLDGLQYSNNKIQELRSKRYVPRFIFTGQPDLQGNDVFKDIYGDFYMKSKDEERLIEDIKKAADNLSITRIKEKYGNVLSIWPEREKELVGILRVLEEQEYDSQTCLNEIRKMLEDVMERISLSGLLLVEWNRTNLAECSRQIGKSCMQMLIPVYIQRSLHSCIDICNPGSHRSDLEQAVKDGRAPYVLRSTIFELMNLLFWCKNLPVSANEREMTQLLVRGLLARDKAEEKNKNVPDDNIATI